jgi:hypothetical protein
MPRDKERRELQLPGLAAEVGAGSGCVQTDEDIVAYNISDPFHVA